SLRTCGQPLTELYEASLPAIIADAALRSIVLLVGAAILALTLGVFVGASAALARRRALASGAMVAATGLTAAIPSFFVAYFLQIAVIVFFSSASGSRLLPVYGFGYDEHVVLPLLAVAIPAVAITAQLTAARVSDVMDAEFVITANAKGLLPSWILRVHVLPHAMPVALEGLGSGLRVSVASLPIVEYIFQWNGIGYIALQSIASRDPAALTASAIVLVTLFAILSFIADLGRPRVAYR
ncbi:MAG TPA: ABC transporter permease, partial [Candidatus Limnocylindria bacterium]|nr:ABC transporter permease [Candidatus Limnocylindria bacterium]